MARIGELDERISIMRMSEREPDGGGGWLPRRPVEVARVWAKVNPISGRERVEARQLTAPAMYRVTIRRRTDLTETDWIEWRGERMDIRFLPRVGSRTPYMTLDAEMGVMDEEEEEA